MAILSASNFLFKTGFPCKEQVSSPLSAQILEFCESELYIQNSEVASSSNCCYDEHSSYPTSLSFPPDTIKYATTDTDANNLSIIFDEEITENDINSVNLDFTSSPHHNLPPYGQFTNQDQFDLTLLQNQIPLTKIDQNHPILPSPHPSVPVTVIGPPTTLCEDDTLSSKFMRFINNPSSSLNCSFMDPSITSYLSGNTNPPLPALETCGLFSSDFFFGELDFKGDNNNGIFCQDPLPRPYNSNELQAPSNESQHLVNGGGSCATPLASEITSLEAETFKVTNKLTTEERKEKIHRYLKKRNERNFSKKIKYACRKTLADSRPRVRGRFAKNDEFGENNRSNSHEEDIAEDVKSFHVVVKEEDENYESSDVFAHISGVNSFKCNYPIQSWISFQGN